MRAAARRTLRYTAGSPAPDPQIAVPLYFLPPLIVVSWVLVSLLLSLVSGWWRLAWHYRHTGPIAGQHRWYFPIVTLVGWVPYMRWLAVAVGRDGLTLIPNILYRPGHPTLFVPWADVSAEAKANLAWGYHEFRFAKVPGVRIAVGKALALRMLANDAQSLVE